MVRINISISEDDLKKIDKYKKMVHLTRSGLIRRAVEGFFVQTENEILEERKKEAIEDIVKIGDKIGKRLKGWDSTAEIRKSRDSRWKT